MTSQRLSMPPVLPYDGISSDSLFVVAVGFEPRATAVLDRNTKEGQVPAAVLRIDYDPVTGRNRIKDFDDRLGRLKCERVAQVKYDRTAPEQLHDDLPPVLECLLPHVSRVVVDISAMSKMLILVLLHSLREFSGPVEVVYTEALDYGPKKEEVKKGKDPDDTDPNLLLSSGIHCIASTSIFSSAAMQGCPHALVAFSGFNRHQLLTLYNELTPQYLYLLNCDTGYREHSWRLRFTGKLNAQLWAVAKNSSDQRALNIRDYRSTVIALQDLYEPLQYSHKFVVAPTGSKLQTLGIFLFKRMHPDVQIVYPTPKHYHDYYSDGIRSIWRVRFDDFRSFLEQLDAYRLGDLEALRQRLEQ